MDNELDAFEAELRRLRPVAPSPELRAALEAALARDREPSALTRLSWFALPIAAAIALLIGFPPPTPQRARDGAAVTGAAAATSSPLFKPVAAENVLVGSADEGDVTLADGTRARRVRRSYLDTITWRNERTNASLTWTVPREEVRVTPIQFQ